MMSLRFLHRIGTFTITSLLILCCRSPKENKGAVDFHAWASTPPMGWNSWDCYGPTVIEEEVKANADYMSRYLKDAGWEYVVVDIHWYVENDKAHGYNEKDPVILLDSMGRLLPSEKRFPSSARGKGFRPLADYVHAKGLKFGIHIMRGIPVEAVRRNTPIMGSGSRARDVYSEEMQCRWLHDMYTVDASQPGAQEYYSSLFALYASWGVDYVKVEDLSIPYHGCETELIRRAIDASGTPMVLSTSPGETPLEYVSHIKAHANMFRIAGDFWDNWPQVKEHFAICNRWLEQVGAGHWPDADMLPLGKIGIRAERGDSRMSRLTHDEQRTVMSLFAIFRSPLMFGGDLPGNDEFTLSLLTNKEVLQVNQHSSNNLQLFRNNDLIAWTADDPKNGDKYLALFNARDQPHVDETKALWRSPEITEDTPGHAVQVDIDLKGAKKIYLVVTQGDQEYIRHNADWIEPELKGQKGALRLTDIKWTSVKAAGPSPFINKTLSGHNLVVDSVVYLNGIGTYANSIIEYDIPAGYDRFMATAGLDEGAFKPGVFGIAVRFLVFTTDPVAPVPQDSAIVNVTFKQTGIEGSYRVRDLWEKDDLGIYTHQFSKVIPRHGSGLYRLSKYN